MSSPEAPPEPPAPPPQVICTCLYCSTQTVVVNGISQPGCEVSSNTRTDHLKKAAKKKKATTQRSKEQPPPQATRPTPESSPGARKPSYVGPPATAEMTARCVGMAADQRGHQSQEAGFASG
ncbi:hypothetical protein FB45DRAFT_868456 [Roridomyces roridus]|uniref:Uncharacterized protein n=1 Tax=Roridomyces roridus TaxID=1738132 RepID=A0AAD7BPW5_9AGAR|nr:hypothetical protein FB45DRAFT_868456 [Roridomyces roridus]